MKEKKGKKERKKRKDKKERHTERQLPQLLAGSLIKTKLVSLSEQTRQTLSRGLFFHPAKILSECRCLRNAREGWGKREVTFLFSLPLSFSASPTSNRIRFFCRTVLWKFGTGLCGNLSAVYVALSLFFLSLDACS